MNTELMFSNKSPEWETPQDLFDALDRLHCFDLDPAATAENAKCEKFFTAADNGLAQNWGGVTQCFVIRLMEKALQNGCKRDLKRHRSPEQRLSCFCLPVLIRNGFMIIASRAR